MRLRLLIVIITASAVATPGILLAEPSPYEPLGSTPAVDVIPPYVASYTRDDLRFEIDDGSALKLEGTPVEHMVEPESGSRFKDTYLPVLFSLLVPGLGETYMGYWKRGAALIGAEVIAWSGYAYYDNQGKETRREFEQFVDTHWNMTKWIADHNVSAQINPGDPGSVTFAELDSVGRNHWAGYPAYHTYASREAEWVNYYENVGKYDWFISGWADWADPGQRDTGLRTQYRGLRGKSNDELDRAERFVYLSLAARAFSLIETIVLVRKNNATSRAEDGGGLRLSARATGFASGEVALVYGFK